MRQALQGAVFPLSAEQLCRVARENGAPAAVLTLLGGLPRGEFSSMEAIEARLAEGARHGALEASEAATSTER